MMGQIRINYKYQFLWQIPSKRIIILTGGRGSGKSFAVSSWLCDALQRQQGWRCLFTRFTMASASISIIPEFKEKLDLLGSADEFHITGNEISHTGTGNDVIFSGIKTSSGNQTAKLKSIPGVNIFIVDEGEEFTDESIFDTINLSIRKDGVPNMVIIIMNPATVSHWVWGRWFENSRKYETIDGVRVPISTHPDVIHIHTTYLDNRENLNPSFLYEIEQVRQQHLATRATDPTGTEIKLTKYEKTIIGAWAEIPEGAIFSNWVVGDFDTSLPYVYGLDDGFTDPMAIVKVAVDRKLKRVYVKEVLYKIKLSTEQVKSLMGLIERRNDLIVADSENPRLISDLASLGHNITPTVKFPGSVSTIIRDLQDYTIVIDQDSPNVLREIKAYIWNDKKAEIPIDDNNHTMDAMRYGFQFLFTGSPYLANR